MPSLKPQALLLRLLHLSMLVPAGWAFVNSTQNRVPFLCGTKSPGVDYLPSGIQRYQFLEEELNNVNIDTFCTIILEEESQAPSRDTLSRQIDVLNKVYNPLGFNFTLKNIALIVNPIIAAEKTDYDGDKIVPQVHVGNWSTLNLVILPNLASNWEEAGHGTTPAYKHTLVFGTEEAALSHDGVMLDLGVLPLGYEPNRSITAYEGFDQGKAAVHEVGHWLGLEHPFYPSPRENCTGPGDFVDDTPAQSTPSYGCPDIGSKDSCPDQPGKDSVRNYMDLLDQECMIEFTPGQVQRMHRVYEAFRKP